MISTVVSSSSRTVSGLTPRVKRLRDRALRMHVARPFFLTILEAESWKSTSGEPWWILRKGLKNRYILENVPIDFDSDELVVGRLLMREPRDDERERLEEAQRYLATQPTGWGQRGHAQVDLKKLLRLGAKGVQNEIRERMARLHPARPDDQKRIKFYEACLHSLEGLITFAGRYAELMRDMAQREDNDARKQHLLTIAETCDRVPAYPARTFREAIQSIHFLMLCTETVDAVPYIVPGRMDRYLQPYLETDLADGRITMREAQELIDCLFIGINTRTAASGAVSVMVGGADADGNYICNDITWMVLQAVEDLNLVYPNVGVAWHPNMPADLLDRCCELMALGRSDPAIFNDEVIAQGMIRYGVPPQDAHEYINSTCVEITPVACSNVWVASPYFNLCQTLLTVLRDAAKSDTPPSDFEAFFEEFKKRMRTEIARAVADQNTMRETRERFGGKPLQSCFTHDCLERGEDIDHGGARYNWIECSFVGLANLVDSLEVVRRHVFEQKTVTIHELVQTLDENFDGREDLRQLFLKQTPKYGNGHRRVDGLAKRTAEFLINECLCHRVRPGDTWFIPGFFCWVMHDRLGRETGATPDGRPAGFPFADGAGPAQGREEEGPTGAILSTTSWDHTLALGGLVLNLKFNRKSLERPDDRRKLAALIETYMKLGGFEVQVNVVDRKTLLAARENPEAYRDLQVRVAGYSDYFVSLSETMQEEILARTEFAELMS